MNVNELAEIADSLVNELPIREWVNDEPKNIMSDIADMLRKQEEEITHLKKIVEDAIKQAFYEDDYHKLKEKFDAQTQEIEHLKNKVQYWKGLHK